VKKPTRNRLNFNSILVTSTVNSLTSHPDFMKTSTPKLSLALAFLLTAASIVSAQNIYQTVGIIGSATPQGWNASTPMVLANSADPHQWTLSLQLTQGEAKFRANDNWSVNWGGPAFPSGTAFQDGPNIPIPSSGYYTVSFNDVTGAYNFQALNSPVYPTVGLIGSATPQGWNASTAMTKDSVDPHRWSLTITLISGEAKFRANDSWDVNWGNNAFPGGIAFQNGANIPIPAGEYLVTFNDATREYFFKNLNPVTYSTVGIIGSATSQGWNGSTPMKLLSPSDPNSWILTTYLQTGELKFRANNSWDVNWGGSDFPAGNGVPNGPNIQIPESSYYTIRFNDNTAAYSFTKITPVTYSTIGIIGTATSSGWDASTPMVQEGDGHTWTLTNAKLFSGEAKFRADNSWTVNWGSPNFPSGTGTQDGPNIPVPAGFYNVTFNDVTGEYNFQLTGGVTDGIVTLDPALPTADEPVTIIYDANQGVSGLRGSDKVYMHSGVVLSGFDGISWNNVVGNWGQDDGVGQMTSVPGEENKWQITIPSIREYYGVDNGVPIFRLGMVFRNSNGGLTGKSETGGDIFVNIDAGDFVRFTAPTANEAFALNGEQLTISAEASESAATISIELNDGNGYTTVAQQTDSQTITHAYTITKSTDLLIRITAQLAGSTVTSEKQVRITLRQPNTIAALPQGMHSGINYEANDATKATLVLLAPGKAFAYVVGDFNDWTVSEQYQMKQTPDGEYFWIELTGLEANKEYVYQYWVEGIIRIGDPYADKVADPYNDPHIPAFVYPNPVQYNKAEYGIATVLQTAQQPFEWTFPAVNGGQPAKEKLVIYELLLRDFLGSHSYDDLADTLSYLKRLGVNAIELLPIMEFEGNESWGYNPSYLFAPDKYYGTKNDLKAFINKAHEEGFVVLLDMVLNHQFGQSPMVQMYFDQANDRPTPESPWFNPVPTHPFNVGYDFNHESAYTKRYVDDVNRYWLQEFHFDGFRFDLSKGFTQLNNLNDVGAWSAYDQSRIDILKRMADVIWQTDQDAYVILEHLAVNEEEKVLADYGMMLWGNMNFAYNSAVNGHTNTDLNWALSSTRGWSEKNLIPYMESHDEERLMVRASSEGLAKGDYDIKQPETALERVKLASVFFYPLPGPKMLWQFGELGYDVSINYNGRVGNKPIPWGDEDGLNYNEDPNRIKLYKTTAAIIDLVNDYSSVFEGGSFSWTPNGQFRKINVSHPEMNVSIAGNFGVTQGAMEPGFQHTGTWYDFFSGRALTVSSTSQNVVLEPGEFHIYVDKPIEFPERGLVKMPIAINTPTNLIAAVIPGGTVSLSWDDNSDGEQGHVLQRKGEGQSDFETIAALAEDLVAYLDTPPTDGVTYSYRVQAVSDVKPDSEWSNTALADLPLVSPSALIASAPNNQSVVLMWSDGSTHESGFVVERAVGNGNQIGGFIIYSELPANTSTFTDSNIRPGKTYSYRLYAKDNDEASAVTPVVSIRPSDKTSGSVISMYPNAASDWLTIGHTGSTKDLIKAQVINMQGIVIQKFDLRAGTEIQLEVSSWPEGFYLVEWHSGQQQSREQLMIRR
jgi:glycosidase